MAHSKPVQKNDDTLRVVFQELVEWGRKYLRRLGVNLWKSWIWIAQESRSLYKKVTTLKAKSFGWRLLKFIRGVLAVIGMILFAIISILWAVVKSLPEIPETKEKEEEPRT